MKKYEGVSLDASYHAEHKDWTSRKSDAHTIAGASMRSRITALLSGSSPLGGFLMALSDEEQRNLYNLVQATRNEVGNLQAVANRDIDVLGPKIAEVLAAVKADAKHGSGSGDVDPAVASKAIAKALVEQPKE